jgi:N-acetylglucosaminyldiphosphoundecaprenol N-acetyl-beta-D-mannosaminyltransferase
MNRSNVTPTATATGYECTASGLRHTALLPATGLQARRVVGMPLHVTSYEDAVARILAWASAGQSRYVCLATVNNVIEAHDDANFRGITESADLVAPDGMPLVWALKSLGAQDATRVCGPHLTPLLCQEAERRGIAVGFYGGTEDVLGRLVTNARNRFPGLHIAYKWSPPFRPLSAEEDDAVVTEINASGARILFVGLGTPKQEHWMAEHQGRISTVSLGVGAAFDLLAGVRSQAPVWMQESGLEWLYRLGQEPRRLWKRYILRNPRFLALLAAQLVTEKVRVA